MSQQKRGTKVFNASQGIHKLPLGYRVEGTEDADKLTLVDSDVDIYGLGGDDELRATGRFSSLLDGGEGNDTLYGSDGDNHLEGGRGADTLTGGKGNDTYMIDNIQDTIYEGVNEGRDTVLSQISLRLPINVEDLVLEDGEAINALGNQSSNRLIGNSLDNLLDGAGGVDILAGLAGDDTYYVDEERDLVVEIPGNGHDIVICDTDYSLPNNVEDLELIGSMPWSGIGNQLSNRISGNGQDNSIDGREGDDVMIGKGGNDTYRIDSQGDKVQENEGEGIDTVISSISYIAGRHIENIALTGNGDIDATGNSLNSRVTGNSGKNRLDGGAGSDIMLGLGGDDTYVVENAGDQVLEESGEGIDSIESTISYVLPDNIENLRLIGQKAVNGTGNDLRNHLVGNNEANRLSGGKGVDLLEGLGGDDIYVLGHASDRVMEMALEGTDLVMAPFNYTLGANVENLILLGDKPMNGTGNELGNSIRGNNAANIIDGGAGSDELSGLGGDDTYYIDNEGDAVIEDVEGGKDTLYSKVSYILPLNTEDLVLIGSGNTNGTGNDGSNRIIGTAGRNQIDGRGGRDVMLGQEGDDVYIVDMTNDIIIENADQGVDSVKASQSFKLPNHVENLELAGNANINGIGNELDNNIKGNQRDNILNGGLGKDTLEGGLGNDIYEEVEIGDVIIEGAGSGIDRIVCEVSYELPANIEQLTLIGSGDVTARGNELDNRLLGNAEDNLIDGGKGRDQMEGGQGNDIYMVDENGDKVIEEDGGGVDTVKTIVSYKASKNIENIELIGSGPINGEGNELANKIIGNAESNIINGQLGADQMAGGDGNDFYYIDNELDAVIEGANKGVDKIFSSIDMVLPDNIEELQLNGTAPINGTGNILDNIMVGNSGGNRLDGGRGADSMRGVSGDDVYYVDSKLDRVLEYANEGKDLVKSKVTYQLGDNQEDLYLEGVNNINGTGNSLDNTLKGNDGVNRLSGKGGNDVYYVTDNRDEIFEIEGEGHDRVIANISYTLPSEIEELQLNGDKDIDGNGNDMDNLIIGNERNNVLSGGKGNDRMEGFSGDDRYILDSIGDLVIEGADGGRDTVMIGLTYRLTDNVEDLVLTGSMDIDGFGNDIDNVLRGNDGVNRLVGGLGDDTYYLDQADDVLIENPGEGKDTVISSISLQLKQDFENLALIGEAKEGLGNMLNNKIIGNERANMLDGKEGNDLLEGGEGNDELIGGGGDDYLDGGNGADRLFGGGGVDYMLGGNGDDRFYRESDAGGDYIDGGNGYDTVDATGTESRAKIDLSVGMLEEGQTRTMMTNIEAAVGGNGNDEIIGSDIGNRLLGGVGADQLTGGSGMDSFVYESFGESTLNSMDWIRDFDINQDLLMVASSKKSKITARFEAAGILSEEMLSSLLKPSTLSANQAALLVLSNKNITRTFVIVNDINAGFSSMTDLMIELTGYSGNLQQLSIN